MNHTPLLIAVACCLPSYLAAQAAVGAPGPPVAPAAIDQYLVNVVKLNRGELAEVHAGRAVSKVMPTANTRDVTVFGIIALHLTREQYAARLANLRAVAARGSTSFGVIGDEPAAADFAPILVDESEYRAFRDCKVNDCKLKLPAADMRRFAERVDWKAPAAHQQLDSLVRDFLQRLATDYRARGNDAMPHYDDTRGTWGRDAFDSLARQPTFLGDRITALREYLLSYPQNRAVNMRELLYWSEERMPRLRPTFTVAQLILQTTPDSVPVLARKLVYANHYFEAALELTSIADGPFGGDSPGIYVLNERHYRFDNLPGGLFNIRGRVRDKLITLVREDLERERTP